MSALEKALTEADTLKARLDAHRPLSARALLAIEKEFEVETTEFIQASNAIEGNSLTLRETELVLSKGATISGKPLKDHIEAINQKKAFEKMVEAAKARHPLDADLIFLLNKVCLTNLDEEYGGRYRNIPVRIAGAAHVPPNYVKVPDLMVELFAKTAATWETAHPILLAADFHHGLAHIHPFIDGNGRTARLAMNLLLLEKGYPLVSIKGEKEDRLRYYESLQDVDTGQNPDAFRLLLVGLAVETLSKRLALLDEIKP